MGCEVPAILPYLLGETPHSFASHSPHIHTMQTVLSFFSFTALQPTNDAAPTEAAANAVPDAAPAGAEDDFGGDMPSDWNSCKSGQCVVA
jgi:hypothetical protein